MFHRILIFLVATLPLWAVADPSDYPLRLQFASSGQTISNGSVFVRGKATLFDHAANTMSALDYSGSCSFSFQVTPTAAKIMSPAKWKKEGSKLSVLFTHPGSEKSDKCDFDVYQILPHQTYVTVAGGVQLVSEDQLKSQERAKAGKQRDLHPLDTDPTHFPLRIFILGANWGQEGPGGYSGQGKANVYDGNRISGLDFSATCAAHPVGGLGSYYPGKWTQGNSRLLILSHSAGEKEKFHQCALKTDIKPFVYFLNSNTGIISTMTETEYKDWREKRKTAQAPQQQSPEAGATEPSKTGASRSAEGSAKEASQKLSIASSPGGGDIEIDGAFMGSTPSVVEISVGEHNIVIRKSGYKPWERKLKLAGGDIKVTAELERNTSKK